MSTKVAPIVEANIYKIYDRKVQDKYLRSPRDKKTHLQQILMQPYGTIYNPMNASNTRKRQSHPMKPPINNH